MSIEGRLSIHLQTATGGQALRCTIHSSRPLHVSQWFVGKTSAELMSTLPLLFNVCGMAQASAAVRALEQASGRPASSAVEQQRDAVVMLESLREQSWHLLNHWPSALGESMPSTALAELIRPIQHLQHAIPAQNLFALHPQENHPFRLEQFRPQWMHLKQQLERLLLVGTEPLLAAHEADIGAWAAGQTGLSARFLHWLGQQPWADAGATDTPRLHTNDADLQQRLQQDGHAFTALPDWQGKPCELSSLNPLEHHPLVKTLLHKRGNGLYTRSVARLLALATLTQQLEGLFCGPVPTRPEADNISPFTATGCGLGHAEAARGRLSHYIELESDLVHIRRLHILAPTEWNFHPRGVVAQGLENLWTDDPSTLSQQAHLLIQTLDPCVGYSLTCPGETTHA